jgi:hypothetical protein
VDEVPVGDVPSPQAGGKGDGFEVLDDVGELRDRSSKGQLRLRKASVDQMPKGGLDTRGS